jgi:hypothetical protein
MQSDSGADVLNSVKTAVMRGTSGEANEARLDFVLATFLVKMMTR